MTRATDSVRLAGRAPPDQQVWAAQRQAGFAPPCWGLLRAWPHPPQGEAAGQTLGQGGGSCLGPLPWASPWGGPLTWGQPGGERQGLGEPCHRHALGAPGRYPLSAPSRWVRGAPSSLLPYPDHQTPGLGYTGAQGLTSQDSTRALPPLGSAPVPSLAKRVTTLSWPLWAPVASLLVSPPPRVASGPLVKCVCGSHGRMAGADLMGSLTGGCRGAEPPGC